MKVDATKLAEVVRKEDPPNLITIKGNEEFLRRDSVATILERIHGADRSEEDVIRVHPGKNPDSQRLIQLFDDLKTPSLFGGSPTYVVDPAESLLDLDPAAWVGFLSGDWAAGRLILVVENVDGRTKLGKLLPKTGWFVDCQKPFHQPPPWKPHAKPWENPLNDWLVGRARRLALKLGRAEAQTLIRRLGTSLSSLSSALDRFQTLLSEGETVTIDLIDRHTPSGEESTLFEFVDTLFEGNRIRTLELAHELLHRGSVDTNGQRVTDPGSLLLQATGVAITRARQLREVQATLRQGGNDDALMKNAGVRKFLLARVKRQAARMDGPRLERLIDLLDHADQALKTGSGPNPAELLERVAALG